MMLKVLALVCVCQVVFGQDFVTPEYATTTQTHHVHHESYESEGFGFIYEGASHQMLMVNDHKCYIFSISAAEKERIHTDAGLRAVELRILQKVNHAYFTTLPRTVVHQNIVSACTYHGARPHVAFYLVH